MLRLAVFTLLLLPCFVVNAQEAVGKIKVQDQKNDSPVSTPVEAESAAPVEPIDQKEAKDEELLFMIVEEMPTFVGGERVMKEFIIDNLMYPEQARKEKIEGRVIVKCVIEKDGSITNTEVIRGIGGGCEEEALRIVNSMPNWIPGKQRGQVVRVSYTLVIPFRIR